MMLALMPWLIASWPSDAPIACWLVISSGTGRDPVRSVRARSLASVAVNPLTLTWSRIGSWMTAWAFTLSSSATASLLPTFALVNL